MNDIALLDQESKKAFLNEDALNAIKNAKNPHILLINGTTRHGKSTTLNQLIRGYKRPHKYKLTKPFRAGRSDEPITRGCSIYGPIKLRTFLDNCGVLDKCNEVPQDDDTDIFLADTEGFKSLDNITSAFIPAILTMIQCSTLCVFLTKGLPDQSHVGDIKKHALLSNYMERFLHVKSPQPLFFVTDFKLENEGTDNNNENDVNNDNQNEEEDDDDDDDDEQISRQEIIDSLNRVRQEFKISVKQKIQENIESDDSLERFKMFDNLDVDISGPFYSEQRDIRSDSPYLEVYWNSLQDIAIEFSKAIQRRGKEDGEQLCNMIKALFDAFNTNSTIPDNETELDEIIKSIIQNIFNEQIKARYERIHQKMQNNFLYSKEILTNKSQPKEILYNSIEKQMQDLYNETISEYKEAELNRFNLLLLNEATSIVNSFVNNLSTKLQSEDQIDHIVAPIVISIHNCNFKEDIDESAYSAQKITQIIQDYLNSDQLTTHILVYLQTHRLPDYTTIMEGFLSRTLVKIHNEVEKLPSWEVVKYEFCTKVNKEITEDKNSNNIKKLGEYADKLLNDLKAEYKLSTSQQIQARNLIADSYRSITSNNGAIQLRKPEREVVVYDSNNSNVKTEVKEVMETIGTILTGVVNILGTVAEVINEIANVKEQWDRFNSPRDRKSITNEPTITDVRVTDVTDDN